MIIYMSLIKKSKNLNPQIWGKHYWFFLHTVAYKYPLSPNEVTKRKYYDLISNFPIFIPDEDISNHFARLLDKYPITPYLVSRESFIRWVWFIHNKINRMLNKDEIDLYESIDKYMEQYNTPIDNLQDWWLGKYYNKRIIYFMIIFILIIIIYNYYKF